jgi:REP element-mobilizing transposase RayT
VDRPPHQPGYRHLRFGRASLAGQVYLVTTVTRRRRPAFADIDAAYAACRILVSRSIWRDSNLLAWVLMPDH